MASPPAEVISRATVVTVDSLVLGLGVLSVSLEGSVMDFAATTTGKQIYTLAKKLSLMRARLSLSLSLKCLSVEERMYR